MSDDAGGLDWSDERLIPAFQSIQHLSIYDLRGASSEIHLAAATCAGLVNRPQPRVYLLCDDHDAFWLRQIIDTLPHTFIEATGSSAFYALLEREREVLQGLIIYDPALPDTINVATTMAGQRDGLVVSPTLAQNLQERYQLPVQCDLRAFNWRHRTQAYAWALRHLLDGSSRRLLAGVDPIIPGSLRSYLVATRTFTYWLDATSHRTTAGFSERTLVRRLYDLFPADAVHLGWFPSEPAGVALLSQRAIRVLPSDYCHNLEVWTACRSTLPVHTQREDKKQVLQDNKVYISFTLSDGDNLQYCQRQLRRLWQDPARGTLPLGWTMSPLLAQTMPALARYYLETASSHDELIAGPSGAGYMFPACWPSARLHTFLQQTGHAMQEMGMSTLQLLDNSALVGRGLPLLSHTGMTAMRCVNPVVQQQYAQILAPYGVKGMLSGAGFLLNTVPHWHMVGNMPVYHNLGLVSSQPRAFSLLKAATATRRRPLFLNLYVESWKLGPSALKQICARLDSTYEVVLPSTLLALVSMYNKTV